MNIQTICLHNHIWVCWILYFYSIVKLLFTVVFRRSIQLQKKWTYTNHLFVSCSKSSILSYIFPTLFVIDFESSVLNLKRRSYSLLAKLFWSIYIAYEHKFFYKYQSCHARYNISELHYLRKFYKPLWLVSILKSLASFLLRLGSKILSLIKTFHWYDSYIWSCIHSIIYY